MIRPSLALACLLRLAAPAAVVAPVTGMYTQRLFRPPPHTTRPDR